MTSVMNSVSGLVRTTEVVTITVSWSHSRGRAAPGCEALSASDMAGRKSAFCSRCGRNGHVEMYQFSRIRE